jgi:hypothetical protein
MKTIPMKRNEDGKTADVHPDEVDNMKAVGFEEVKPAKKPGRPRKVKDDE